MFPLKPFQEKAVAAIKEQFLGLWKSPHTQIPLIFKAPTGSGKTVMLAQFLQDIASDPRFIGNDIAFVWLSKGPALVDQSKRRLNEYYGGASGFEILGIEDLSRRVLPKNSIFFVNWEKLKGQSKDVLKVRRENEHDISFDGMIAETHRTGRGIVAIIDEEHLGADTDKAIELIDGLVKPKIVIRVSATPKLDPSHSDVVNRRAGIVEVPRDEVVHEGLIKEKIVFQTREDLEQGNFREMDQDQVLLELAFERRAKLASCYRDLGVNINPLVLIQLPNDDQVSSETSANSKKDLVLDFLKNKNVSDDQVAVWLTGKDKINLENIESNTSGVSFLIFKLAAATGWDCPRAGVLVMFREIGSPTFLIQTVGRILRMPSGFRYPKPELNMGYVYTNYSRNEVATEQSMRTADNLPAIFASYRKSNISPLLLESVFMGRSDYNDLGDSFQETFKTVANEYFAIGEGDDAEERFRSKGFSLNPSVTNGLIIDVEIDDYDDFKSELLSEGGSWDREISQYDLERLYNILCFKLIARQTDENKKFAPQRSWGKLKTGMNVWLLSSLGGRRLDAYKSIVRDLLKEDSTLRMLVGEALERYRPIRDNEVSRKLTRSKRTNVIQVPPESVFYTDRFAVMKVNKAAVEPFYLEKEPFENEEAFVKFLEESDLEWWYKNGDSGSEHFSIAYFNSIENQEKLFYPDWIVRAIGTTWIIDTKAGLTAEAVDTKYKAEALNKWLRGKAGFAGGIAVKDVNGWKLNNNREYSYTPSMAGWKRLSFRKP